DDFGFADEDEFEGGVGDQCAQRTGYAFRRTAVTTHYVDGDGRHGKDRRGSGPRPELFFGLDFGRLLDDALAAIETVRGDAMTQVSLTRLRIHRQRGLAQAIVRTMHAALRRRFATLLNGHGTNPLRATTTCVSTVRPTVQTVSEPALRPRRHRHPVVPAAARHAAHTRFLRHVAAHSATRA